MEEEYEDEFDEDEDSEDEEEDSGGFILSFDEEGKGAKHERKVYSRRRI